MMLVVAHLPNLCALDDRVRDVRAEVEHEVEAPSASERALRAPQG